MRAALVTVLLCLVSTAWTETFEEAGATGRGPRITEQKSDSTCKQETNWQVCADDDWGTKCPSGCRVQGLSDKTDKEFSTRIDAINKKLKDSQSSFDSIDIRTKETYKQIKDNLVAALQTDGSFNQVSESLRHKIDILKLKVTRQIERIKLLQRNIRDQVVEIKRLEVDIDIKLRACKGSCARGVDFNVDMASYENIQKQLLQAESTDLRTSSDPLPMLKMKPMKDSTVDSKYKTLALEKEKYPIFSDVGQFTFVLEGKTKEVTGHPGSTTSVTNVQGGVKQPSQTTDFTILGDKSAQPGKGAEVVSERREISCTKTIQKKIVKGPTGTKEEISEVISGGEECEKLERLKAEGKGELGADGTYTIRVTGSGTSGGFNFPSWEDFVSGKTVSSSSSVSGGSTSKTQGSLTVGDDEFDDFSHIDLGSPSFRPEKTSSGSSTYSKTVYSSSSTKDGYHSGKQMKSGPVFEDLGPILTEKSEEDMPDFGARSVQTGVKTTGDHTGTDCADILQKHSSGGKSGIFKIRPEGSNKELSVFCDQDTQLGGWVLIQQREDGSVNFNRTWQDYKNGFGSVDATGKGELWLGNEYIHLLTRKETILRIELGDWSGNQVYAEYSFHLGSESEGYALNVNGYEGSAGDSLVEGSKDDGEYTSHANMKFSTYDRDSDKWEENCAEMYGGGWWYNNCQAANLNGIYYNGGQYDPRNNVPYEIENGIVWVLFKPADYSLKTVKMKIRPVDTA
ncbi:fibrinogen alpha chain [Bufo gargarizans]|uniref:fibrinogen alpha chain n=1 Tax=Bufo gargarizans TaxID=30331 RepID=UPI001CF3CECF|nr:fibrinogen alpha chain [Bufo gargarizans]